MKAINALQDTEWSINTSLFEVMKKCVENKTLLATFDKVNSELGTPEKNRKEEKEEIESVVKCLKLFEAFPTESFYFPYMCDYRGRVYPRTTVVSPQESDPRRSALQFATGKKLGKSGMRWLKIHLANQYGKSGSFEERLDWVEKNENEILNAANAPLNPKNLRFWMIGKKKWSFLRACIEFRDALEAGEVTTFVSHLPIGVDGTCNGLQHIAALTRDEELAKLTNLVDSNSPADCYKAVADQLKTILQMKDATLLEKIPGGIDRNFTKKPTMAVPYGIRRDGIRNNIQEFLIKKGVTAEEAKTLSTSMSEYVKLAINNQLGPNVNIFLKTLEEIAKDLARENNHLEWLTPTGFPIVEGTYWKKFSDKPKDWNRPEKCQKAKRIENIIDEGDKFPTFTLQELWEPHRIVLTRQMTNVRSCLVHALDASHMAMTVCAMYEKHECRHFSMIHDDFRVHAADLETLNIVLREEFCKLHEPNLLQDFVDQLRANFPDVIRTNPSERGNFNINEVKKSKYFFS